MSLRHPVPRKNDPRCGCVEGYYQCGFCSGIARQRIWNKMSAKDRAYDRYVDPANSRALDSGIGVDLDLYERGCSCHLSAPCGYCTRDTEEEALSSASPTIEGVGRG